MNKIKMGLDILNLYLLKYAGRTEESFWADAVLIKPMKINDEPIAHKEWKIIRDRIDRYFLNQRAASEGKIIQEYGNEYK